MQFSIHPSARLVNLFKKRPYQGQHPGNANILFLNSDANYSPEISDHPFFNFILEYHEDGVSFWRKYGCHHPFLLDDYPFPKTSGGRPFHQRFSKIGLGLEHADSVSFIEMLDVPTIGNKSNNRKEFYSLMSDNHLKFIDNLITEGNSKLIFVSGGVLKDMLKVGKRRGLFSWLNLQDREHGKYKKRLNSNEIHEIYHFSSSHVFQQIPDIRASIEHWLKA
ncbi:MAG: hypothetical protein IH612_10865 [Desulfofustis sp.]|nr:hypothetical protein [Desulfofustis sp.]